MNPRKTAQQIDTAARRGLTVTDTAQILALVDELRRHSPGISAAEIAEYARRYRGWTVTAEEIRAAVTDTAA